MLARHHRLIRLLALVVTIIGLVYMARRSNARTDATSEGLSKITEGTKKLIDDVTPERPVVVTAYVSKEVPQAYVATQARLLNILREMEASGNEALTVRILQPERFSEEAQEAVEKYGIAPRAVMSNEGGRMGAVPVFLGVAFASGPREEVIPFFDRGLSVEYEIARALRVVVQEKKRVIGLMRTDAALMGQFDMKAMRQIPGWRIVDELRKQYEVRTLSPGAPVPGDVDVIIVPQVSSMSQAALDSLAVEMRRGRPTLLVADPMPVFDIRLSPSEPMLPPPGQGQGMMGAGPSQPKGDYKAFLEGVGVKWEDTKVVYDTENPNPRLSSAPRHVIFVGERADGINPFDNPNEPIVDGLAQVVTLFGGALEPNPDSDVTFEPMLTTGNAAGYDEWSEMTTKENFLMGLQGPIIPRRRGPMADEPVVLAARLHAAASGEEGAKGVNAIILSDLDMFADSFFSFHERGGDVDGDGLIDIRFDNVTFLLNCIDTLAGDTRFVELRKRQPEFRRLTEVEALTEEAREKREGEIQAANDEAEKQIEAAQAALDEKVAAIKARTDLDATTKQIMARSAEEAENRRLQQQREAVERDKAKQIQKIETEHQRAVDEVQNRIRLGAILLPPIPAILMGLIIFARKRRREQSTIPKSRQRGAA
jgi:ABC-2 type transport system permease protein